MEFNAAQFLQADRLQRLQEKNRLLEADVEALNRGRIAMADVLANEQRRLNDEIFRLRKALRDIAEREDTSDDAESSVMKRIAQEALNHA